MTRVAAPKRQDVRVLLAWTYLIWAGMEQALGTSLYEFLFQQAWLTD